MTVSYPSIIKMQSGELLRWEPALYNNGFQADLSGVGRYNVRRTAPRARTWHLRLNGKILATFASAYDAIISLGAEL